MCILRLSNPVAAKGQGALRRREVHWVSDGALLVSSAGWGGSLFGLMLVPRQVVAQGIGQI